MREVHVIVPEGIDDRARPSGGNTYDRQVCQGLATLGWTVHQHPIAGAWPRAGAAEHAALARAIRRIPDDAVVLLDGLVACAAPAVLVGQASRVRQVVLVHRPADCGEPLADLTVVGVAAARPPGIVDAVRDDDVNLPHSVRS